MPIYEYRCQSCGNVFDTIRSMDTADLKITCEKCNSDNTVRMLSKCYAHNSSGSLSGQNSSCGNCSGGCCSSCCH